MKKRITLSLAGAAALLLVLSGCNKQIIDTTFNYTRAIIDLPGGQVVDGKVQSWGDYEGDQLQIKIDGVTYLVHASDTVMIAE